jgi:hypothetical protein
MNAVYGKLAPFVTESLQPIENKRKTSVIAYGRITCTPPVRKRILETALDVIADADVRGEEVSITREVSRRLRVPADVVNRTLMDWLIRTRQENGALKAGVPLEAIC